MLPTVSQASIDKQPLTVPSLQIPTEASPAGQPCHVPIVPKSWTVQA